MPRGGKPSSRLRAERGAFDLLFDLLCDPKVARAILKSMQRKAAREYAAAQDLLDKMPK